MLTIRPVAARDWPAVWAILEPIFRLGTTYAVETDISEAEAHELWFGKPAATYVAEAEGGQVLGSYYIKANQAGPGAHVCNCGYVVGEAARGRGVATLMCEHSQEEARALGFRAMQYNLVVSTNPAVRLWQKLGFEIVGTLPGAFAHPSQGDVDAYVMYKRLI